MIPFFKRLVTSTATFLLLITTQNVHANGTTGGGSNCKSNSNNCGGNTVGGHTNGGNNNGGHTNGGNNNGGHTNGGNNNGGHTNGGNNNGGHTNGGNNNGGHTNGGNNNGGHTNGGNNNGGHTNGGNNNGGHTNGGNNNGGHTNGGNNNGGHTNGGGTTGGSTTGGTTNGGTTNGGTTNGGTTNGGTTNGGTTNGGTTNGGTTNGGTTNGGTTNGGTTNGGTTNGGTTNGGTTNGGTTNGGTTNGGTTNGGTTNGGTTNGGTTNGGTTNGGTTNGGTTNGGTTNGGTTNGGTTNGGTTNGGTTNGGTTNGGTTNGGTTNGGTTNGGTTNGGTTNGGTTNGGTTNGGTTNGGTTNGGTTNGGTTNGGTTNGGTTNGGTTNGGTTNGGTTNGGTTNGGGSTTGGSTTGGSTTGGETTGGTTNGGSDNGGSDTGGNADGGGSEPEPVVDEAPSDRGLRARFEPLFYMDYDAAAGIIAIDKGNAGKGKSSKNLSFTKNADLYQKTSYELLEGGLGGAISFYYKNAAGTVGNWWAQVGLMPMKGTETLSVRYFNSLETAKATPGYKSVPSDVTELYKWQVGDNLTYKSKGGLIYVGGTGVGLAGLTMTKLAQGTWETYVEKVDKSNAYVKITNSKLDALATGTGAALAAAAMTSFKNADDGFSYLINLNSEEGRKVYQDLVRGNVAAAQKFASEIAQTPKRSAVTKIDKFKRFSKGNGYSLFMGVPIILNAVNSENNIQSRETSDLYLDNSKMDSQAGIYDYTRKTRAFDMHTLMSKSFYGVRYQVQSLDSKQALESSEFGRFGWVYQDDTSSMRTLHRNLQSLMQDTGFDQLKIDVPSVALYMEFTNISLNVTFTSANIQRLLRSVNSRSSKALNAWSEERAAQAYNAKGLNLCRDHQGESNSCEADFKTQTRGASAKMYEALAKMGRARSNSVAYTKAFAEFGKAAMENQVTFQMALGMAGQDAEISFVVEGTLFTPILLHLKTTNVEGRFVRMNPKDTAADSSLNPIYKKSRFHGVITNRNLIGLGAP